AIPERYSPFEIGLVSMALAKLIEHFLPEESSFSPILSPSAFLKRIRARRRRNIRTAPLPATDTLHHAVLPFYKEHGVGGSAGDGQVGREFGRSGPSCSMMRPASAGDAPTILERFDSMSKPLVRPVRLEKV